MHVTHTHARLRTNTFRPPHAHTSIHPQKHTHSCTHERTHSKFLESFNSRNAVQYLYIPVCVCVCTLILAGLAGAISRQTCPPDCTQLYSFARHTHTHTHTHYRTRGGQR